MISIPLRIVQSISSAETFDCAVQTWTETHFFRTETCYRTFRPGRGALSSHFVRREGVSIFTSFIRSFSQMPPAAQLDDFIRDLFLPRDALRKPECLALPINM